MSGMITVWDLKTNKPIYNFSDSSQQQDKHAQLCWNPEIATQIAVTYDDEHSFELQIWDLRNPQGPVEILGSGHTNKITALAWSPADSSLIVTGGLDRRLVCWNYKNSEIIETVDFDEEIIQATLSRQIPNQYTVTLKSGTVVLGQLTSEKIANIPPKWFTPAARCAFSASNTLVSFNDSQPQKLFFRSVQPKVHPALSDSVQQLVECIDVLPPKAGPESVYQLIAEKIDQAKDAEAESQEWQMIKTYETQNPMDLIQALGFSYKDIEKRAEDYTGKVHNKSAGQQEEEKQSHRVTKVAKKTTGFANIDAQAAEDFFGSLASQVNKKQEKAEVMSQGVPHSKKLAAKNDEDQAVLSYETVSKNVNWDTGIEKIIKQNLIVGNYMGAIDCAMKCGRVAEALLIAYSQNKEAFEDAMNSYFVSNTDLFVKNVLRNMVKKNIDEIALIYDMGKWRECACIIATQAKSASEFQAQMLKLADRFVHDRNDYDQAILCALLSKNYDKIITLYWDRLNVQLPQFNALQRKVQICSVLQKLAVIRTCLQGPPHPIFDKLVYELVLYIYDGGQID